MRMRHRMRHTIMPDTILALSYGRPPVVTGGRLRWRDRHGRP